MQTDEQNLKNSQAELISIFQKDVSEVERKLISQFDDFRKGHDAQLVEVNGKAREDKKRILELEKTLNLNEARSQEIYTGLG